MIGVFDSGLGGLTVVLRLRELLPEHDLLFFADQAHVPYGDRREPELLELLTANLAELERRGARAIVAACNTSCAIADKYGWPPTRVPVLDLIESAGLAVQLSGALRIGVVATTATARSGTYARHIVARVPQARVLEIAAPALVPLVEAGDLDSARAAAAVRDACAPLAGEVDAIVLGCTHYPLLLRHFQAAAPGCSIIDPAVVHAERAAQLVAEHGIASGSAQLECVTNGDPAAFESRVRALLSGAPLSC